MREHSDIVIVGGGLNGTTLGLALARTGHHVSILDSLPRQTRANDRFDGRSYALALGSQRVLVALGLWPDLVNHAQPMLGIKVTDGVAGRGPSPLLMHFDHAEIEEGPMGYMVEERYLRHALLDRVDASPNLTYLARTRVVDQQVSAGRARIILDTGATIDTRLIVGADGRSSGTAIRAGIGRTGWSYDQLALVCAVMHEKSHNGIAHQLFLPGGPLAILPLTANRCSVVWSERRDLAETVAQLDDRMFLEALRPRFGDFLGQISLAGDRFTYPLGLSLANALVADRVALIGDAAHQMHPIAGQGLNAGLRDVAALAETVTLAARRGEDFGAPDVLARYQQWRRFDIVALAVATDTFNRLFSNDNPILRLGRDLGMGVVNAMPRLRRGFIREAAGLTGDLPRLMQGHPI
ncbi:MAG: FAD-dependent monooxygenase [Rhodobacteraceae bacterium]|nr:FAD-dependent monooxygenase [Paracoccaceae bacterium]